VFAQEVAAMPYGVLGQQLLSEGNKVQRAPEPSEVSSGCVFVDPAGLHHIQPPGGPSGAGGAAGAIYRAIGIDKDESFPAEVVAGVTKTGDAKYHMYTKQQVLGSSSSTVEAVVHVIHAVGPDFNDKGAAASSSSSSSSQRQPFTWEQAVAALANTYRNILAEFVSCGLPLLRLLPVSGGIFAGAFKDYMPTLTFEALQLGFTLLTSEHRTALLPTSISVVKNDEYGASPLPPHSSQPRVVLCVYPAAELAPFVEAGFKTHTNPLLSPSSALVASEEMEESSSSSPDDGPPLGAAAIETCDKGEGAVTTAAAPPAPTTAASTTTAAASSASWNAAAADDDDGSGDDVVEVSL
jgi:hypothetical protein